MVQAGAYRAGEAGEGACNCVLRNVDGEIQTWRPILLGRHGSASLCRDGQKTKWRLQCSY